MAKKAIEKKITKNTLISEALELCPEALVIMFEHGLHCVGCGGADFETIEQGCQVHGMEEKEIEAIVEEINQSLERKVKKK
ncbi:MAG: DUF1858 domain-containing protein [Candidatus Woesearchaeota archaeon]